MKVMICFDSRKFDITAEPPNDINPIHGQSFLAWLRPELEGSGYAVDGPDTEDWGWYLEVAGPSGRYTVGASAMTSIEPGVVDWTIQVWRRRSLRELVQRKGRVSRTDALVQTLERLVREKADDATETWTEEHER